MRRVQLVCLLAEEFGSSVVTRGSREFWHTNLARVVVVVRGLYAINFISKNINK